MKCIFARYAALVAGAALSLGNTPENQPATKPALQPSDKWAVDHGQRCTLKRSFRSGADKLTIVFITVPATKLTEFLIIEPNSTGDKPKGVNLRILPEGAAPIQVVSAISAVIKDSGHVVRGYFSRDRLDELAANTRLDLLIDDRKVSLLFSGGTAALNALASCELALLQNWGVDPQILARVQTPPTLKPFSSLDTHSEYPSGAFWRGEHGKVMFRLDVDAQGKVQKCAIIMSSNSRELDEATCKFAPKHYRFNPARDKEGLPVPSIFVGMDEWMARS